MKSKKLLSILLVAVMMVTMASMNVTTAFAATGSKTGPSSGKMSIVLQKDQTGDSSSVAFTVSGLSANAKVTKIEVNTGSLTAEGAMLTNYLTLKSSNSTSAEKITWGGAANTKLTANGFKLTPANGTYTISFNCTCLSGAIKNGIVLNTGTKTYTNPTITVYWDDSI